MSNIDFKEMRKWVDNLTEEDKKRMRQEIKKGYDNFEKNKNKSVKNGKIVFSSKCNGVK